MRRKCDNCDQESTVHEVTIKGGQKIEKHLCESCAREAGIAIQSSQPITELLTKFSMSSAAAKAEQRTPTCSECGLTYLDFRQQGILGCASCYSAFEEQLNTLIERAHEGGTHHVGKTPKRAGGAIDRQKRIVVLRKQLSDAISAEQYERAASIRDQLMCVEKGAPVQGRLVSDAGFTQPGAAKASDSAESQA